MNSTDLQVRDAIESDFEAITRIFAWQVINTCNNYEYDAPDTTEMLRRAQRYRAAGFPFLVAVSDNQVLGFAYANQYRARRGYRFVCENSVYVEPQWQGRGVASALLADLIERCRAIGMTQMIAVIGDSENNASIALHKKFGFVEIARFKKIGFKHERWLDNVQMQKAL